MKISLILLLLPIIILSIFSISQVYAQSSSNNTLRECVDWYMGKFGEAQAIIEQKLQQKQKDKVIESVSNSTLFKEASTDACVLSYAETGKFGQLLSEKEQEKFITLATLNLLTNSSNKTK
jgi:membrane protein YqaA with SNARE-associated domain